MAKKFPRPRFVDITSETDRLVELDHFWIIMDHCKDLNLWRFSYLSEDETGEYIPKRDVIFYEPILLIHGYGTSHTIFNWFARELWYFGFRKIFAVDNKQMELQNSGQYLTQVISEIKQISKAHRISVVAYSTGGIMARYFVKFTVGADSHIRILAMCGVPHDKAQYLKNIKKSLKNYEESELRNLHDYFEDINSTIDEKELCYLTQVNLGGSFLSKNTEGVVQYVPLSDAINISIGQTHLRVHKHKATFGALRNLLIPSIAVFKIRLISISNMTSPLGFRIHYKGRITQRYPRIGEIRHFDSEKNLDLAKTPIIIFCSTISLDKHQDAEIVVNLYKKYRFRHKSIGMVKLTLNCEELPRTENITINGQLGNMDKKPIRVKLAVYTYIP